MFDLFPMKTGTLYEETILIPLFDLAMALSFSTNSALLVHSRFCSLSCVCVAAKLIKVKLNSCMIISCIFTAVFILATTLQGTFGTFQTH